MIDTVMNLLFRCSHRRLTRPVTPVSNSGVPHGATYVVCLDCGKQFAYDTNLMRIGKPIGSGHADSVLETGNGGSRSRKVRYALWASLPLAVLVGTALKGRSAKKAPVAPDKPASPPQS